MRLGKIAFLALTMLLLLAFVSAGPGCASYPPETEGEAAPPDGTPTVDLAPNTQIISGPSGTITYGDVTFEWTGSDDYTASPELAYSYYLEGYDSDYSPFTSDTSKTYSVLPDGSYIFYIKARDASGNVDLTPAAVEFTVVTASPGEDEGEDEGEVPDGSQLLILPNSEVSRIAVGGDGKTIYALDAVNCRLYKSDNGGYGWRDISAGVAGAPVWVELVVAPDDPNVVAIVTNGGAEVCLSTSGGAGFAVSGLAGKLAAGELIQCIAISPQYGGSNRELVVGTSTGVGGGRVWLNSNLFSWTDVSTGAAGWLPVVPAINGVDVFALSYSPCFAADRTILAVVASGPAPDTDDAYLYAGIRDLAQSRITWNTFPGYPVEICTPGGDTPGSPLTYAALALPLDYIGSDMSLRRVYASWSDGIGGNNNDDVYRIDDATVVRLYAGGGAEIAIASLAYHGEYDEGKLLAGEAPSVQVYRTLNAQSKFPDWKASDKPPTGPNEAQLMWSPHGEAAYCGTCTIGGAAGDQSAFSISVDDGLSWNQTGLIDTF